MDDSSSGVFAIMLILMVAVSLVVRSCGVGNLTKTELDNITSISNKLCESNNGVRYVDFFPSSKLKMTVYCKNGAEFKRVNYVHIPDTK
jgi:hypothetical protein